jgi:hypothetical protein
VEASMTRHAVLVPVLLAVIATAAAAQKRNAPQGPFASVKTFNCSFPTYATADPMEATPRVSSGTQEFSFTIDTIDFKKKNAEIVGGAGTALAAIVLTQTGLNVIEQTPIGNFNLTTVFASGGQGQRYPAVHSRHLGDVSGPPRSSQAYGSCEIVK